MDATAVAISVLSASVAFVGLVFSALAFARSSPAKIYKREQDKAMRKLATQTLLMDRNMGLITEAARAARYEAKRLKALFDNGELRDPHVAGLDLRDYDGSVVGCDLCTAELSLASLFLTPQLQAWQGASANAVQAPGTHPCMRPCVELYDGETFAFKRSTLALHDCIAWRWPLNTA